MTIKTFNANRVGGGTFELEQDATTGEYKLKEVVQAHQDLEARKILGPAIIVPN